MTTTTANPTAVRFSEHNKTIFQRFLWKEFRMTRGLWAAVAIMGLLVQCAERMLLPGSTDFVLTLLYTALSAAVLYAVGAAATAFSVEHEEETYDLLTRLPTTWWPPFAAKLLVTFISAVLLALFLSIPLVAFHFPPPTSAQDIYTAFGMMGFAIIEAIAWGTLFSLLIRRPLLAAIMTLVVGALAVEFIISYVTRDVLSTQSPASYVRALPARAAIVVALFACCTYVARSWLASGNRSVSNRDRIIDWFASLLPRALAAKRATALDAAPSRPSRGRMLARLLWQTWRESWKLLLAPFGVAVVLFAGLSAALGLTHAYDSAASFVLVCTPFFVPALYGAMAFYCDQRRGNYRFLAEHAARPRYIWFARHIVWLSALIMVGLLVLAGFAALVWTHHKFGSRQMFVDYLDRGMNLPSATDIMYNFAKGAETAVRAVVAASFGGLVVYGIGQLFSMAIGSEILAAFITLMLTSLVTAIVAVVFAWKLSPVLYLLPIFAGLMLATWLRAPDWIAGRNSWRCWLKPSLAIVVPLLLSGALLPYSRLDQLAPEGPTGPYRSEAQRISRQEFQQRLAEFRAGDTADARKTADMYASLATKLSAPDLPDFLERWRKPKYLEQSPESPPGTEEINEAKIPAAERDAFNRALKQQQESRRQFFAGIVDEAIEISKRPSCRFHFDPSSLAPTPPSNSPPNERSAPTVGLAADRAWRDINSLIGLVAGEPVLKPDEPARRFLAALRMGRQLRSGQPSVVVAQQLKGEQLILKRIGDWALESGRTKEELRDLLEKLTPELQAPMALAESLLADHVLIAGVIAGKQTPFILSTNPIPTQAYLAYLANQLWWERERAAIALYQISRTNVHDVDRLADVLAANTPREIGVGVIRHWLRPTYGGLPPLWEIVNPAAATSYLVSLEYEARVPIYEMNRAYCDNTTWRRATLLQIALALYHLEHHKYPAQLADLVPAYFEQLPLDPYSRQAFQYLPSGLDLPLKYWAVDGNPEVIGSGQPLFWSVGVGNVRLVKWAHPFADNGEPPPDKEKPAPPVMLYDFVNEDQTFWNDKTLAFPLPK
jgi:ABC-type transport system involved in multi-copper enzyme maturation permease subunit